MAVEFVAKGSPQEVAGAIERYAHGQGRVSAIVVPWESSATMLSMAVTSVKADGWAIEHTNLGTVTLTDAGDAKTTVAVVPNKLDHMSAGQAAPEDAITKQKLASVFDRFAHELQTQFGR
jgi:hypothetical protein